MVLLSVEMAILTVLLLAINNEKTKQEAGDNLKVAAATFLLVCFVCLKESTLETRKMFFILLRKLFSFLR